MPAGGRQSDEHSSTWADTPPPALWSAQGLALCVAVQTTTASTAPVTANILPMNATSRDGEEVGAQARASTTPPIQITANVPTPTSASLPRRSQLISLTSPDTGGEPARSDRGPTWVNPAGNFLPVFSATK